MDKQFSYSGAIWPSIFTTILLIVLVGYAWRKRNLPGGWWFVIYCLFVILLLSNRVTGYLAQDIDAKIFCFNIEYIFWLPSTTAMTCFILEYSSPGRWITRRSLALLSIFPLLVLAFTFSNNFHNILFRGFGFNGSVIPLNGPIGWASLAYNLGLRIVSIIALIYLSVNSPHHRWPAVLILIAIFVVGVLLVLDPFIQELHFFYVPEKAIPVIACAIALFGFRIFDPIPLARNTIIEQLQAGMVVLDLNERVVSLNPAAERILNTPLEYIKGKFVKELLPTYPEKLLTDSGEIEIEINIGVKPNPRYYMVRICTLNDFRGLLAGFLLLLTDITEQKYFQLQILQQQRSLAILQEREQLARELHDNLGQVFAYVNAQGQAIHLLLRRGDLLAADEYVCRLLDVAREADVDIRESIVGLHASTSEHGLLPALTHYLARYEKNYGIQTQLIGFEISKDELFEPLVVVQLLRILQEALTNVRKHADASSVRITFVFEDGWARITISDDGQGFDPAVYITAMEEHIGLRVMHERAEEVGGNLKLKSTLGKGTELVVRVPLKEINYA